MAIIVRRLKKILLIMGGALLLGMNLMSYESFGVHPASGTSHPAWGDWKATWSIPGKSFHWPVFGQNLDGRLMLFTAFYSNSQPSDSLVVQIQQFMPNFPVFAFGASLGGDSASGYIAPAFGQNLDGGMEVFAQHLWYGFGNPPCAGPHYEISHVWQISPNGGLSNWSSLEQPSCSIDLAEPYLGKNQDGRLDVFAKGSDHYVYHRWQTAPNNGWNSTWASIGKPAALSDVSPVMSIGRMQDGRLVVFVLGSDYEIYQNWQNTAGDENNWSGWVGFGAPPSVSLSNPVVNQNLDGRLQFFTAGSDGVIWSKS